MGYDSGMEKHRKQEIKVLVHGRWDPRRGISFRIGRLYRYLWRIYYLLLLLWIIGLLSGFYFFGFAIVGVIFYVYLKTLAIPIARLCDTHQRELCLWCRYPLTDLEGVGKCPECGGGYRKELCRELYRLAFNYDIGPNGARQRIITHKWLWARALRERDRSRDE